MIPEPSADKWSPSCSRSTIRLPPFKNAISIKHYLMIMTNPNLELPFHIFKFAIKKEDKMSSNIFSSTLCFSRYKVCSKSSSIQHYSFICQLTSMYLSIYLHTHIYQLYYYAQCEINVFIEVPTTCNPQINLRVSADSKWKLSPKQTKIIIATMLCSGNQWLG